jgi:hypothetical protein
VEANKVLEVLESPKCTKDRKPESPKPESPKTEKACKNTRTNAKLRVGATWFNAKDMGYAPGIMFPQVLPAPMGRQRESGK